MQTLVKSANLQLLNLKDCAIVGTLSVDSTGPLKGPCGILSQLSACSVAEQKTVFRHVRRLLSMVATLFFALRSAPVPVPVLEVVRTLLMSAIEVCIFPI